MPAAGLMTLTSCSSEEVVAPGELNGNFAVSVKISNAGAPQTRAGETLAALERERTIGKLYAVVFHDNGGGTPTDEQKLYKVFEMTGAGSDWQFEMGESGQYIAYFVANPGDGSADFHYPVATVAPTEDSSLKDRILALEEGVATPADLKALTTTQTSGNGETVTEADITYDKFLMFSKTGTRIITARDYTSHITVALERASARVDVINQADHVRIDKVEFHNDLVQSFVYTPANGFDGQHALYKHDLVTRDLATDDETSATGGLVGSFNSPTQYSARIYTYEHLVENDGTYNETTRPYITISYSTTEDNGATWTASEAPLEVKFKDYSGCKDEDGLYDTSLFELAPDMSVLRNHLYRIRVTTDPNALIVLPILEVLDWEEGEEFVNDDIVANPTQFIMNARLWVNRVAPELADAADLSGGTFTPAGLETEKCSFDQQNWFVTNADGSLSSNFFTRVGYPQKYRIPTPGELALLFPTSQAETTTYADVFGTTLTDTPTVVYTEDEGISSYTYVRYVGTEQCAAYKYIKSDDPKPYYTIKIIALDSEGNLLNEDGTRTSLLDEGNLTAVDFDAIGHLEYQIPDDGYFFTSEMSSSASLFQEMTVVKFLVNEKKVISDLNGEGYIKLVTDQDTHATKKP